MKWTPCSERLPEEGRMVLVSITGSDMVFREERESFESALARARKYPKRVSMGFISNEEGWEGWTEMDGFPFIVQPIAWMPLPEPYEGTDV